MLRHCIILSAALLIMQAHAQQRLEIIPLQHRLADQVLPSLRPLVESGGSISAASGKVIVRASPANIAQIRQALAAIDTPQRRLQISVRQGGQSTSDETDIGLTVGSVTVQPRSGVSASANGRAYSSSERSSTNASQRVQTVEGGEASIFIGKSLPIAMRQTIVGPNGGVISETTQFVDIGSGFAARPELVGDRVMLTISPQMQKVGRNGIESSQLSTTVSGRLGEWIPLGGTSQQGDNSGHGVAEYRSGRSNQSSDVWLKVDVID